MADRTEVGEDEERDQLTAERMMVDSMLTRLDEQEAELTSLRLQVEEGERERDAAMAVVKAAKAHGHGHADKRASRERCSICVALAALAPIEGDK